MEFFAWALAQVDNRLREIEHQREAAEKNGVLGERLPVLRELFHEAMRFVDFLIVGARDAGIPPEDLSLLGAV